MAIQSSDPTRSGNAKVGSLDRGTTLRPTICITKTCWLVRPSGHTTLQLLVMQMLGRGVAARSRDRATTFRRSICITENCRSVRQSQAIRPYICGNANVLSGRSCTITRLCNDRATTFRPNISLPINVSLFCHQAIRPSSFW